MALSTDTKVDRLWKKLFGTTKTADGTVKFASNETIASLSPILPMQVWGEAEDIPAQAPDTSSGVVTAYKQATAIRMTNDPTSPANVAWLACASYGDPTTRYSDFIPSAFGTSYAPKVWIGDPLVGPAARIFPDATGEEWVFDAAAGVVSFDAAIPGTKTATVGSGSVTVAAQGIYIEVCQYSGGRFPASASTLAELTDVDMSTASPSAGDVLTYSPDGVWEPMTPVAPVSEGNQIELGAPDDGSWSPGLVTLTDETKVTEAIDLINEETYNQKLILAKLVPAQPPAFPNAIALAVSNSAGNTPLLASGVTDNSSTSVIAAGAAVTRTITAGVSSNAFNDVGPGDSGTVAVKVNGSIVGSRALTGTGDSNTYNGLVISDQKDYPPATPGFWKSIDLQITLAASLQGVNKFQITHSGAGNTSEIYFVRDNIDTVPTVSGGTVVETTAGTKAYSSSIPHYGTGGQLTVNASYSNLSGETYYGGVDPFTISGTNGIIASKVKTYANLTITTPIARQTTAATAISAQLIDVDGTNVHNSGTIQGLAKNVKGSSTATNLASSVVLVKRGTAGARIDEGSIGVTGLGSSPNANAAIRVSTGSGDKPAATVGTWDPTAVLAAHEATVVGGVLKHDQTNYSTGFLPAGPDLSSGRSGAQYATFSFKRTALSAFKIAIAGTYAGVYIKLPGVSDAQPNGGGWWDMFQSYDGSGIPGETGDTNAGCALGTVMSGASGTFQATFGTGSSTNSTGNEILVRVKLTSGQSVTALSFSN